MTVVLAVAWGIACALPLVHRALGSAAHGHLVALGGARRVRERRRLGRGAAPRALAAGPVGVVAAGLARRWRGRDRGRAVARGLPLTLDVITMAARAGHTPRLAVAAAARWSPTEVAEVLAAVEHRCRLGATLVDALTDAGRTEPALRPLADGLVVAERNGAPVAELLARLADEARATVRRRAEAHARRVPVRLLFPLIFLVLPAFGLLTVVPALATGLRSS